MSMGRATCPLLWAAALGAAQPCGVSLTTWGIAPASLRYDRLTPVARVAGPAAWQATPSWTVYQLACHRLLPWLRVMFAMVPDAAWPGSDQRPWGTAPAAGPLGRPGRPSDPDPWVLACCCPSLRCPWCAHVCGVLSHLAPVHRCARPLRCIACAVSWACWLLFTGVLAWCVALRVCGVLGHLAPVHRCARSVHCVAPALSWAL